MANDYIYSSNRKGRGYDFEDLEIDANLIQSNPISASVGTKFLQCIKNSDWAGAHAAATILRKIKSTNEKDNIEVRDEETPSPTTTVDVDTIAQKVFELLSKREAKTKTSK